MSESQILQHIPSVTQFLQEESIQKLILSYSRELVLQALQEYLEHLRKEVQSAGLSETELSKRLAQMTTVLASQLHHLLRPSLRQVVNASGVLIHTNVGRAPLSSRAAQAVVETATHYSNLEYNLDTGKRGHRDMHFEARMNHLVGGTAATVCNNNSAAIFLVLNTLASGKNVLVSRGELIEIGGSFRLPTIMERSGAVLKEIGTTNKTSISDYRQAIDDETALILRVHPSNYKILGFTQRPRLSELVELSCTFNITLVEDLGSGLLFPSELPTLKQEPIARSSLSEGVDLICFSADKLLGGPQAGIIAGKARLVNLIRSNPLMRVCRVGKMTYAALESTLIDYEKGIHAETIPVHRMLAVPAETIKNRAESLRSHLDTQLFKVEVKPGYSLIGGGSAPEECTPTYLLAVTSKRYSVNQLEQRLREFSSPVVARIEDDQLILDLRTVFPEQEDIIISAFTEIACRQ